MFTAYHAKYYAHALTLRHGSDGVDRLSQSLFDAGVDLNPHQIDAALFALKNPLSKGVILADEVGLGKTIEAALVLGQYWAERKRRLLIICPASLRKQWAQELLEKFNLPSQILDAQSLRKLRHGQSFDALAGKQILIMSYQFAVRLELDLRSVAWNLVVIDEAHKLRNAHKPTNRIGQSLKRALSGRQKLLLTATPLQNSLLELYGLSTLIDDHQFGDETAFRRQYMQSGADLPMLRTRLKSFVQRSLRKDVLEYVKYTERKPLTQKFHPTDDEQKLYESISEFLQNEDSYALPKRQRHLTTLILRKLLASSAPAIVATLQTICKRLDSLLHDVDGAASGKPATDLHQDLLSQWVKDEELEQEYLEELDDDDAKKDEPAIINLNQVRAEISQIQGFINAANSLKTDTKAQSLLQALAAGFGKMAELNGPKKAIIFTESRRTQEYLAAFLASNGHADKIVTFNGSNNGEHTTAIYQAWLKTHQGSERITGSPQVDRRTALIDHFRGEGNNAGAEIMIATEAAAEGVNLQFCALIVNYDLPWNPQRIEQRIGRCHRYGQRFDVVVINFLNMRNHADQRVLELLTEKFSLFSGVFGASDEVLGRIESGIDFEKRILQIVETCRLPAQIDAAFSALQTELEQDINQRIADTQSQLLEHFDEDVHDHLKLRLDEAEARLDKLGKWFWGVTRHVLDKRAQFDDAHYAFSLSKPPLGTSPAIASGRYQLIRGAAQPDMLAHPYRLTHTLGEWTLAQARDADTPVAEIHFDLSHHPSRISVLDALRGVSGKSSGWLRLVRLQVQAFDTTERLLFIAATDDGATLDQELCEKLLMVESPAEGKHNKQTAVIKVPQPAWLDANSQRRIEAEVATILDSNQKLFMDERDKLEKWAEDKLLAAEDALQDTKARIAQRKRDARKAMSLDEQAEIQNELRELEQKQRKQRQDIFAVEDQITEQRDALIAALQARLAQTIHTEVLYSIRWNVA
jgi:hypothetical protein